MEREAAAWLLVSPGCDSALYAAISKPWRRLAMTIFGQRAGLAVLMRNSAASLFFLRSGRIFSCLGAATHVAADPSGSVPGVGGSGYTSRRLSDGEALGVDRVSAILSRVCGVRVKDLVVISLSVKVLSLRCNRLDK